MKTVLMTILSLASLTCFAAPAYNGPSSILISDKIAVDQAILKLQQDEMAAQAAQAPAQLAGLKNDMANLQKKLSDAKAAGK